MVRRSHSPRVSVLLTGLSVQREIFKNTTLEANYLGNKGTHLLTRNNIAQAFAPDPNNITPVASRRPYQNFTGVYIDSEWRGRASYQSGNVKLEHRSTSLTFQAAYTWNVNEVLRCSSFTLPEDRKSTRLNSSHLVISYAVFCLKKIT